MVCRVLFIAACLASASVTYAQSAAIYPSRPIRLIVPIAPGGGMDSVGRAVAQKLTTTLGQAIVVDNRSGAGGIVGAETTLAAIPDGYTLMLGSISTLAVIPAMQKKPSYDPLKDFAPVSLTTAVPYMLVVHPSLPVQTVGELVKLAKAKPGDLSYGSPGYATGVHLSVEYFSNVAGIKLLHVPYKGATPALLGLFSGQTSLQMLTAASGHEYVVAGKVRALGVATKQRLSVLPNVPTIAEVGYPGFESSSWHGIVARVGTPPAILRRLNGEVVRAVNDPKVKAYLESMGNTVTSSTPEEFKSFIESELKKWKQVSVSANIQLD